MRWLILMAFCALPLQAEEVVLGLSRDSISISTDFDGSEILIYGAIKRESPISAEPLQVIVTVAGPSLPLAVRRKSRVAGIWVNTESVEVDHAPSFYAVATSAPFDEAITHVEDLRHKLSIPQAIRSVGAPMDVQDSQAFTRALIRIREAGGLYKLDEGAVTLREQTLFETAIRLPANLTEGAYPTRIFLTRDGEVISILETHIDVRKVGIERWLYSLSRQQPLAYGLLAIAIAALAGWGASALFRLIRQQ